MARNVDLKIDAGLYVFSALLAGAIAHITEIYAFRVWAGFAAPGYLITAIAAVTAIAMASRRSWTGYGMIRLRLGMAALSFIVAVIVPLAYEVHARAEGHIHLEQSEVVVIEQAAKNLVSGKDPYAATFDERGLESRPQAQHHFAYLPLMLVFGLPRAFFGPGQFTDARVVMALVTLAALGIALTRSSMTLARRLRAAQVAVVLPSGALFMVTGGDDLSVLALLLLGLVMLQRRDRLAWPALVAAALLKQTAWPLLLVLLLSPLIDRTEYRLHATGKRFGALLIAAILVFAPFILWQPGSFVRDVVLFPIGLTSGRSFDQPPTFGSLVLGAAGAARAPALQVVLVASLLGGVLVVSIAALLHLSRIAPISTAEQACFAGLLMLALIVTSPISRPGYLIYPFNLLTLGLLIREEVLSSSPGTPDLHHKRALTLATTGRATPVQNPTHSPHTSGASRAESSEEN